MSSLEGGFSPGSALLGAGTVLGPGREAGQPGGEGGQRAVRPGGDRLPGAGAGAGAGEGARAPGMPGGRRSPRLPLAAAVPGAGRCLPAPDTVLGRPWDLRPLVIAHPETRVSAPQTAAFSHPLSLGFAVSALSLSLSLLLSLSFPPDTPLEGA